MTEEANEVDLLRFPLWGSRLIEASAGTGKTYTIAALYVRLVLGHGGAEAFCRPLTPPEILVVTFTEAATKELRERIRRRLSEAARWFGHPAGEEIPEWVDEFLRALRAQYPEQDWPGCERRLQAAAEWMDEAAVSTIHGWCHRMLREHAFDSGSLFSETLETETEDLLLEAVRDYWREFFTPLPAEALALLRGWFAADFTPEGMQRRLSRLLPLAADLEGDTAPAEVTAEVLRQWREEKEPWGKWVPELQTLFDEARNRKELDGRKVRADYVQGWLAALVRWRDDPLAEAPDLSDSAWNRLTRVGLDEAWKGGKAPRHEAIEALENLHIRLERLHEQGKASVLAHAARWVAQRFAVLQRRRAQMGFDDLLTRLDEALRGPNGERLAARIRQSFPVALIDEFQDTDPVQYRIFEAVYAPQKNDPQTALILIGDPKQAIYAFRGADIYTYLEARLACDGRRYTLRRNFRSTPAMVEAVNRVFLNAQEQNEAGAFLFKISEEEDLLPFLPATARGLNERFVCEGQEPPALVAWWVEKNEDANQAIKVTAYRELVAHGCAEEIVRLLRLGREGRAGFVDSSKGTMRPVKAADVAVLVHTGEEAKLVRAALARRGVRSVYLSERSSVFASPAAADLQRWLEACAEPQNDARLRSALASATLGRSWAEIESLERDVLAWETEVARFLGYRDLWRRQGVLPMLRRLMHDFDVPARLLAGETPDGDSGERRLTDLLHLSELLQKMSRGLDGEHALIRALAEARQDGGQGAEERQLRLESDEALVKVVTVHKAKGLEYPLVFLPFACSCRPVGEKDFPLVWHDEAGRRRVSLVVDETALVRAERERLAEDVRKLYVALTRARFATWIGVGALENLHASAMGYALGVRQGDSPAQVHEALEVLAKGCDSLFVAPLPVPGEERLPADEEGIALGPARTPRRRLFAPWAISSYSGLRGALAADPQTPDEAKARELVHAPLAAPTGAATGIHALPPGAATGTFLHGLLEWAAQQGFDAVCANGGVRLRDQVARRCAVRGWTTHVDMLTDWLLTVMQADLPLPGGGTCQLAALSDYLPEMEFWFSVPETRIEALDALVQRHTLQGADRPRLTPGRIKGMIKGFIDLVFCREGRYYVLDYKSNVLGATDAAYGWANLEAAVLEGRYDLQYALYLHALHRHLRVRLPDYDPQRHLGGAVLLFLRGIHDEPGKGVFFAQAEAPLLDGLDALLDGPGGRLT
ncbi:exodeoxyribonuclease V subunit beta [Tepidiphilus sp. J10]|uniref:exodeoxyribonuclease V subunit beta n=1 Tax=Tepidiphilus sp. J10 TaxID=2502185 RepID=UPI00115D1397|nr:exodeoxyribonuclease V subunit beta [Tepidiphilus sp. J10]